MFMGKPIGMHTNPGKPGIYYFDTQPFKGTTFAKIEESHSVPSHVVSSSSPPVSSSSPSHVTPTPTPKRAKSPSPGKKGKGWFGGWGFP